MLRKSVVLIGSIILSYASAQSQIPNTKVSYQLSISSEIPGNSGQILLREQNDQTGSTALIFQCTEGGTIVLLRTKNALMTLNQYQQAQAPQIGYRIDNGEARSMRSFYIPNDEEPVLNAVNFALNSMFLMPNLLAAKSKITMTTLSTSGKPLSYTFPTKGLTQALKAVNNCR